jgi:hypothetical protein
MPLIGLDEVVRRLPSLYFVAHVPVVGLCVFLRTSSFFRPGSKSLSVPVACLHVAWLLGVVPPMFAILESL